jgi:hypothetical protein
VGSALDAQIERDIACQPKPIKDSQVRESTSVGCVGVDSAWLRFSSSPKSRKAARVNGYQEALFSGCEDAVLEFGV